ncbi:MAG TPA: hypothetical protein VM694_30750 [Polyangium sp.]|nr:hypothetical protein [Polyangium sp.]
MGYDLYRADHPILRGEGAVATEAPDDARYLRLDVGAMERVREALANVGVLNESYLRPLIPTEGAERDRALRIQAPEGEGVPLFKLCFNDGAWLSERECALTAAGLRAMLGATRAKLEPLEHERELFALLESFVVFCEGCAAAGGFFVH